MALRTTVLRSIPTGVTLRTIAISAMMVHGERVIERRILERIRIVAIRTLALEVVLRPRMA